MVPTSTNDAWASVSSRNRDIRPMERTPTIGQKSSSKKKNTLRAPMSALRSVTAHTARSSFRQLNEDLLQLRLAYLHVANDHAVGEERAQDIREPLLGLVHQRLRERDPLLEPGRQIAVRNPAVWPELAYLDEPVDARPERAAAQAVEPPVEGDDLADPQAPEERRPAARHVEPASQQGRVAHDVVAEHRDGAAVGREQGGENREQRRLAGAIRAEEAEDRAP